MNQCVCKKCGTVFHEEVSYCNKCGTQFALETFQILSENVIDFEVIKKVSVSKKLSKNELSMVQKFIRNIGVSSTFAHKAHKMLKS